jgi:hypothetical protein
MENEMTKMKIELSDLLFFFSAFNNSNILKTNEQKLFIRSLLIERKPDKVTRLYRATDPNVGFTVAKFHSLCDGKGPTLTLI